ncbi:secretion system X pseudopilin PulG-like protein [Novimethylophilus kurashikiensis]|uniref:Secretion system X pseudopilin PulG-like protein n=1 Tax=Novimethylophilus kurashikiensis TaxID=1825523 RepID=A0A2R5FBG4_9PROT|nr:type II secretion system protein [Novimethylophilus kurashikiensis]GBG15159.1 secretion system X pseudopilin PulG-like protein [Novimethylophilus kurashikiensis]
MHRHGGFTYFGTMFVVTLIGLALTGAAAIWQVERQREKEAELLFVGQQYIEAIASYYHAAPNGIKKYPRTFADLLRDPRYLNIKRHLRKPWHDPLTGSAKWGVIKTKQGGIAGIYSTATGSPLKQAGFGPLESLLTGKTSYAEWKFVYIAAADSSDTPSANEQQSSLDANNDSAAETGDASNASDESTEEETGEELLQGHEQMKP